MRSSSSLNPFKAWRLDMVSEKIIKFFSFLLWINLIASMMAWSSARKMLVFLGSRTDSEKVRLTTAQATRFSMSDPSVSAQKRCNSFYDRTLHTSQLLMNGHHILRILILYITAFGISCRIWCTKTDDFRLQKQLNAVRKQNGGEIQHIIHLSL